MSCVNDLAVAIRLLTFDWYAPCCGATRRGLCVEKAIKVGGLLCLRTETFVVVLTGAALDASLNECPRLALYRLCQCPVSGSLREEAESRLPVANNVGDVRILPRQARLGGACSLDWVGG